MSSFYRDLAVDLARQTWGDSPARDPNPLGFTADDLRRAQIRVDHIAAALRLARPMTPQVRANLEAELEGAEFEAYTIARDLRDDPTIAYADLEAIDPDLFPRRSDGCECGEYGGSEKECPVHGYEGTDPDVRARARGRGA